ELARDPTHRASPASGLLHSAPPSRLERVANLVGASLLAIRTFENHHRHSAPANAPNPSAGYPFTSSYCSLRTFSTRAFSVHRSFILQLPYARTTVKSSWSTVLKV